MATGFKSGGRTKGTKNADQKLLDELIEKTGQHPVAVLFYFCTGMWKELGYSSATLLKMGKNGVVVEEDVISPAMRLKASEVLTHKLLPDKKSVVIQGDSDSDPVEVNHNIDLREMIKIAREPKK